MIPLYAKTTIYVVVTPFVYKYYAGTYRIIELESSSSCVLMSGTNMRDKF